MKTRDEIIALCTKHGIEWDMNKRWEKGLDHHPESIKIKKALQAINWTIGNDSLDLSFGGDGDNGEDLLYSFDVFFELQDAGEVVV